MNPRPKLHIALSPLDRFLEISGYLLLGLMWAITAYAFGILPGNIPIHYNAAGEADGYGNKSLLLLLPLIPTVIFFGISFLARYPHIFNYMVPISEENALKQYTMAVRLLRFLKLSVVLIFLVDILFTYIITNDITTGPGGWNIVLIFLVLLAPTLFYLAKSFRAK